MAQTSQTALLSRREAANILAVSVDTVARLIDRGELQSVRIGRSVLVPLTDVQSFVERRLAESNAKTRELG